MGFFTNLINTVVKATRPTYNFKDDSLIFKISSDEFFSYDLNKYEQKTRHDPYISNAYTIQTNDISLEYIRLSRNTSWNGSALGFFETLFRNELKINKLEILESFEVNNYVFKTYEINDNFVCFFIYVYTGSQDIFILDTKGYLYKNILQRIKSDYIFNYEDKLKGSMNFDISLVKKNALEDYFSLE